jgi:MFS family permease
MASEVVFVPVALAVGFAGSMMQLTLLVGLLGLTSAPVMTAVASFAPFLGAGREQLDRANAWIEGAGSLAFVFGTAIGAGLVSVLPISSIFIFDAATSVIAVAIVAGVRLQPVERTAEPRRPMAEFREGLRASYGHRGLRFYLLLGTAVWMGFGAFGALEPLFYRDVVHVGVQVIGWSNTVFGLGLMAGAWLLPRLPRGLVSARGIGWMAILTGLGAVLYVGTADLRIIMVGALLWGAIIGVSEPLLRTLIQADSPDALVGRIAGISQVHRHGGELLPLAFAPALAAAFGVQAVLIGGGVILAIVALAGMFEAAAVDRLPRLRSAEAPSSLMTSDEPISPNP